MHRGKQYHRGHLVGAGDDETGGDCPAERLKLCESCADEK
jgi:hypothetical protein